MSEFIEQLVVLGHLDKLYTEVRYRFASGSYKMKQIFFNDVNKKPLVFIDHNDYYVGINQRDKESGLSKDVPELKTLVIDIDPVRPKNEASTNSQHTQAIKLAEKIASDFSSKYPECYVHVVDSGSGAHVYIPIKPIKISNYKNLTVSLKRWSDGVKKFYERSDQKIDSIFDLSRVIRIWGTHNNKSNRTCRLLSSSGTKRAKIEFDQTDNSVYVVPAIPGGSTSPGLEHRFKVISQVNPVLAGHMNRALSFESRSESDYSFIGALLKSGFTVQEIKVLVVKNPSGRQEDIKKGDVERVTNKFISNGLKVQSTRVYADKYFGSLLNRQRGIPIDIRSIDDATGGLRSDCTIISARPGNGKTSLMCQIARNLAKRGKQVLFFPTELSTQPIYDKIMAQISEVDLCKFRDGTFTTEDRDALQKSKVEFAGLPLVVVEDFSLTLFKIIKRVNEIKPDILMLDYIQAMSFKEGGSPRELASVMQGFTDIAGTHDIPVIIASQLSRPSDVSTLSMAHLKGSGALEEKARTIYALVTLDWNVSPRPVDLHILKNSYGETGKFPLMFNQRIGKFTGGRE